MRIFRYLALSLFIFSIYGHSIRAQVHTGNNRIPVKNINTETAYSNLSPSARLLIHEINKSHNPAGRIANDSLWYRRFPVYGRDAVKYIGALARVNNEIDIRTLQTMGVAVGSKINDIWSLKIPLGSLSKLDGMKGIEYLETDRKIQSRLDSARKVTGVDSVHQGIFLPRSLTGKGVVVGIIDDGFDYTHPTFLDTTGTILRIKRIWNQSDNSGVPPVGLGYGTELSDQAGILQAEYSNNTETHGTHVAGIAAGSGYSTGGRYRGMAPDADLVFVQYGNGQSDIQDGIFYIADYAQSVHEPAVINISLGSHIGPHDGTSLLDQAIDYYSDNAIIVGAAGNEGGIPLHIAHNFTGDTLQTLVNFENQADPYQGDGYIDIWGAANTSFSVSVKVYDQFFNAVDSTDYFSTLSNGVVDQLIANGKVQIEFSAEAKNIDNQKPEMLVYLSNHASNRYVTVKLTADSGETHIWNNGLGGGAELSNDFPGTGIIPDWSEGDMNNSVGEIGSTANRIISVGAFITRNSYTDLSGVPWTFSALTPLGGLAPFSSHGPTVDGRVKPDITAPGALIVSSFNSFDTQYGASSEYTVDKTVLGGKTWYYGAFGGTSMATPMVTGIIALMLEANRDLTPEIVKDIFRSNSVTDDKTGIIPTGGSNLWGWGKVNAYKAVYAVLKNKPAKPVITASGDLAFCQGGSVTLSAPSGYRYRWSSGDTTREITVSTNSLYSVRVDSAGYWSDYSDTVDVTVYPLPVAAIDSSGTLTFCEGDSVMLTIQGDQSNHYQWFIDSADTGITGTELVARSSGTYTVEVTDSLHCTGQSDPVSVTVNPVPAVPVITADSSLLTSDASAGNQWFYNDILISDATADTFRVIKSGNYFVKVTNNKDCNAYSDTVTIETKPVIVLNGAPEFCKGDSVVLSGPAGYHVRWSTGDTSQQITIINSSNIAMNISDDLGFTSDNSDTVHISVLELPRPVISLEGPDSFCTGDSVLLVASCKSQGSYEWYRDNSGIGKTDSMLFVKTEGMYYTRFTDSSQCMNYSDTISISVFPVPLKPEIISGFNELVYRGGLNIQWYFNNDSIPGEQNDTLQISDPGNYFAGVMNDSGCVAYSDTLNITVLGFEANKDHGFRIYPNPARHLLYLETGISGQAYITITDMTGRIFVKKEIQLTGKDEIGLAGLGSGFYLLRIAANGKQYSTGFIVE